MSETLHVNPPTSTIPLAAIVSHCVSVPSSSHSDIQANKPKLIPIQSKVLEDINHDDIRLDFEDNPAEQGYFKQDLVTEPAEVDYKTSGKAPVHKKEEAVHVSYFKPKIFFKFLLMHILFYCLLGPFIVILSPIFGIHVLRNQGFVGYNTGVITQSMQYCLIVTFILVLYLTETPGLQMMEVYMVFVAILIRMIIISTKYSYQNVWWLELIHTKTLTEKDTRNDLLGGRWGAQTDDVIEEEIQSAILNLEIDSPLFFFNFLCEIDPSLKNQLSKKEKISKTPFLAPPEHSEDIMLSPTRLLEIEQPSSKMRNLVHKHKDGIHKIAITPERKDSDLEPDVPPFTPYTSPKKSVIIENETWSKLGQQTQRIFQRFLDFFRPQQFESSHLYGYSLLFHMIKVAREVRYKSLGKIAFLTSIIRALIPTFYRIYMIRVDGEDIPVFTEKPYLAVIIFLTNILFFWANLLVITVAIKDLQTKVYCFKQIGYLLSPKKIYHFKERKLYPTLNIFDPLTLKTWSSMRRIMTEYGKKYTHRSNLNIGITMILYIFILTTFILQMLGVFTAFGDPLILIIFGYESVVFFAIFITVMLGSAFLNSQYKVHKNLLKRNKTIVSDFLRLSHLYVGRDAIKPDNMIYKEGIKVLRKELGDEDFETKLVERAEKLTGMIDDFIEDLEFEEEHEPFKVMGITINYELLQSLALAGVSLIFAVGQSFVN